MNLLQISEALKGVPKQFLVQEATQPSGRYPQFMVVAELSRRTSMEKRFAAAEAQMPTQTIAEQKVAEATSPMPTPTTMAMGQMRPNMPSGMVPSEPIGQETMGMPAAVRMYEGGRIKANTGIFTGDGPYSDRYKDPVLRAELEADIRSQKEYLQSLKDSGQYDPQSMAIQELNEQLEYSENMLRQSSPANVGLRDLEGEVKNVLRGENITDAYIANQLAVQNPNLAVQNETVQDGTVQDATDLNREEIAARDPSTVGPFVNDYRSKPIYSDKAQAEAAGEEEAKRLLGMLGGEQVSAVDNTSLVEQIYGPKDVFSTKVKDFYADKEKTFKETFKKDPEKVNFRLSETLKTQEGFNQERAKLRTKDYLAQLEANNLKEKQSIEKDKKLAVPLAMISAGLNIATTSSPNVWAALGEGGKEGLKQWMSVQKDARAAEQELRKAENNLALARDARQEGDLQAYDRYVENFNTKKFEADKLNFEASQKFQEQIANREKFRFEYLEKLEVDEFNALLADESKRAELNTTLVINEIAARAKSAAETKKFLGDMIRSQMDAANDLVELELEITGQMSIDKQIIAADTKIGEQLKTETRKAVRLELQRQRKILDTLSKAYKYGIPRIEDE